MFVMLILFLSAYVVFWTYSRRSIYVELHEQMRADWWQSIYADLWETKFRYPYPDTNKLYEDFLWNCLPVIGELRWWRTRPR